MRIWLAIAWLGIGATVLRAEGRWPDEREAGPFLCHADFALDDYQHLLGELARLQRDLARTVGVGESHESIHLFLFGRQSTYEAYLQLYFPEVPSRRALYIKERGPGMVFAYKTSDFEVDVRHEGTHALLHADLPMVPLWLDEGLAEYFEVPYDDRAFANPHLAKVKWSVRLGQKISLEKLEQLRELEQMGPGEYRQAWAWVHFILHGSPAAHEELVRYLSDIRAHTPPGQLSERLHRRIPNMEKKFAEHFKQWKS